MMKQGLFALALAGSAMLGAPQASAAPIVFDIYSGSFVTLPATGLQTTDYTGVYQSPTFNVAATIAPGATAIFAIQFTGGGLRVSDNAAFHLPTEGVIFRAAGTGTAVVNPVIRVLNATGSYRQDATTDVDVVDQTLVDYLGAVEAFNNGIRTGFFSADFPNDPTRAAGVGLDITQFSLMFLGVQLELFNGGPNPISISQISFQAVGSAVEIVGVPAPSALPLLALGLGLIGFGLVARRRTGAAA